MIPAVRGSSGPNCLRACSSACAEQRLGLGPGFGHRERGPGLWHAARFVSVRPRVAVALQERIDILPRAIATPSARRLGSLARRSASRTPARVGVLFPVLEPGTDNRPCLGRAGSRSLVQVRQFGLSQSSAWLAQLRFRRVIERRLILALPGGGQDRAQGGGIAVLGLAVVTELGIALQRLGPEAGGGAKSSVGGELGEAQALGVVVGLVLAPKHGRKPLRQGQSRSASATHCAEGYRQSGLGSPARDPFGTSPGPRRSRPGLQDDAEVAVGLGVVGLEPDRLAVFGDGLVELPLALQGVAEVVVGLGVVGLEPDRLAVFGDRLVELPLARQGDAEVGVGLGVVGLEPDRRRGTRRWPRRASPGPVRAMPRLLWASASSGLSRIAVAVLGDGLVELPLALQGVAEVDVGRGVVGLEPDRLAVLGDGLVELALAVQGDAEVDVGRGVVGLEPDRLAARGHGGFERLVGLSRQPLGLERHAQAAQVPAVAGPQPLEIAEHGDGLVGLAPLLQGMGQLVGRLGADRSRRRVEADRLVAARRASPAPAPGRS